MVRVTSNADSVIGRLETAARNLQPGSVKGVTAAALAYTTAIRAELLAAGVKGGRLHGVGRNGAAVGVGFTLLGTTVPTALVKARGPLHLLESDTAAHDIAPKRRSALRFPGTRKGRSGTNVFVGGSVSVKGTQGKHPFEKGIVAGTPVAQAAIGRNVIAALEAVYV